MLTKDFLKRFLALAFALVLVLGLSVPSFALVQEVNYSDLPSQLKSLVQLVSEESGIYLSKIGRASCRERV